MEDQPKENPRKRKAANTGPRKKRNNNNDDAIDNNKSSNPTDTKRRRTPGFADYHPGLVGDWVDRNYQLEQDSRLPKQQVFAEYYAWGDAEGLHLMSPNIFGKFLFQHFGKGLQSCRPGRIGSQTPHYRNLARRNPSSSDGGRGGGGIPGTTTTTSATTTTPAAATTHTPRSSSDGDGQRGSLIHKTPGDHTRLFGSFQIGRSHQHHQHHPSPSPPTPPPHPRHYQHLRSPPPPPSSATTYHAYAMPTYPSPPPIQDHPASSPLKPKRGSPGEMPNPYPGYTTTSNTNNKKCKISTTTTTTTTTVNVTLNTHDAVRDYGEGEEEEEEEEEELVGGVHPHLHHAVPLSHEMNLGMAERSENVHPKYGQDYNQRGAAVQDPETEYHMLHQALQKYKETLLSRCDSASSEVDEDQGLAEQHEPQASLEANVELYGHYLAKGWGHKAKAQFSECLKALGQEVSTYTQGDQWHIVLGAHILAASGELWVAGFSSQQLLAAVQSRHRHKPEMVEAAFRACVRWYAELCNKSG